MSEIDTTLIKLKPQPDFINRVGVSIRIEVKAVVSKLCMLLVVCCPISVCWGQLPDLHQVEVHLQQVDQSSPIGYWDIDLSYPQLAPTDKQQNFSKLNDALKNLVEKYTCSDKGEKNFTGKVKYLNGRVLVVDYESEWMCATMSHPDFVAGTISFDLISQEPLSFEGYKTEALQQQLIDIVITKARASHSTPDCSQYLGFNRVFPQGSKLIFAFVNQLEMERVCEYQVGMTRDEALTYFKELPVWN